MLYAKMDYCGLRWFGGVVLQVVPRAMMGWLPQSLALSRSGHRPRSRLTWRPRDQSSVDQRLLLLLLLSISSAKNTKHSHRMRCYRLPYHVSPLQSDIAQLRLPRR
jgi:hypothetical protein